MHVCVGVCKGQGLCQQLEGCWGPQGLVCPNASKWGSYWIDLVSKPSSGSTLSVCLYMYLLMDSYPAQPEKRTAEIIGA